MINPVSGLLSLSSSNGQREKDPRHLGTVFILHHLLLVASTRFTLLRNLLNKTSLLDTLHQLNSQFDKDVDTTLDEPFHQLRKLKFYENKATEMNERISSVQTNLQTSADYESMLEILKKLNYISRKDNILRLKGQVAAIFGSGKELLLTELIYQNLIDHLTPSEIAALISAIIFQGKRFDDQVNDEEKKKEITPALHQAKQQLSRSSDSSARQEKVHLFTDSSHDCRSTRSNSA